MKRILIAAAILGFSAASPASSRTMQLAQDGCFAAGQEYARAQGATLVGAEQETRNGKQVCKVIVLFDASNGNRPRREIVYLDA